MMNLEKLFTQLEDITNELFIEDWKAKYLDKMDITSVEYHEFMDMTVDEFVSAMQWEDFADDLNAEVSDTIRTIERAM